MRDLCSNIQVKRGLSPSAVSDNTAQVSQIIDLQGYDSCTWVILTGSLADADVTFAVTMDEGDAANLSDAAAVAAADLVTQTPGTAALTAAGFTFAADDNVRKVGYIGKKRYVRLTITPANNASAANLAVAAILGHPVHRPVIQAAA